MCKECIEHRHYVCECGKEFNSPQSRGAHQANCDVHKQLINEEREKRRLPNGMFKCENPECPNEHDGSFGNGRFCSEFCRRSFCGKKAIEKRDSNWKSPFCNPQNRSSKSERAPLGTWKCETCGKVFETKHLLYEHKHSEHKISIGKGGWNKGLTKETDERVKRCSEKLKGHHNNKGIPKKKWTEEQKQRMSDKIKEYYKQYPEKHPARRLANNRNHMTYGERVAYDWLTRNNIQFTHHFHFNKLGVNRYVDFYIESKRLFIEIDGEFWHKNRKALDDLKDMTAKQCGIDTIRIPAKDHIETRLSEIFSPIS